MRGRYDFVTTVKGQTRIPFRRDPEEPGAEAAGLSWRRPESSRPMVTAFVLLETDRGQTNAVADALVGLDGVAEVHSVAGRYDLVAVLRTHSNDALATLVTDHVRQIPGIARSETLIAFRATSRYDLERLFGVGL